MGKPSMTKGAPSLFHSVLTYGEVIEYWKKNHLDQNYKL
jgi:hypothetical protein